MSDSQKEEEKTTAEADPKADSPESPDEANAAADPADADAASPAHDGDDQTDEDEDEADEEEDAGVEANQRSESKGGSSSSTALLIGALCLAAGFGIGWFGHDFQIKKEIKTADAAVQGEGEGARGPCKDWETALCTSLGEKAHACVQAKSAGALLSGSACSQATKSVTATIDKIKAERASCTNMETKLCAELGADSKSCELVKAQTPSFPPDRCDKMLENYDQVLSQLKMMEQRGGLPGGPGGPGHPGGHGGPGGPGPGGPGGPPVSVTRPPAPAPAP